MHEITLHAKDRGIFYIGVIDIEVYTGTFDSFEKIKNFFGKQSNSEEFILNWPMRFVFSSLEVSIDGLIFGFGILLFNYSLLDGAWYNL